MPCMQNGRPVPGNKGACPTGSYWSDTQGDGTLNEWADVGNFFKRRYTTEDGDINTMNLGLDALIFVPGIGWTARGAMAGGKGIAGLMGRMFTKGKMKNEVVKNKVLKDPKKWEDYIKKNPKGVIPGSAYKTVKTKTKVPDMRTNRAGNEVQRRQFAPVKSAVTAGIAAQGADYLMPFTPAGIAAKEQRVANAANVSAQKAEDEQVVQDAAALEAAKVQAEKDRVANLGFWEKMKEPGYWDEVDGTGLTRLDRLGQLMTYYGQTPKQRAATTSPADRWAEMTTANAATAASLQKSMLADSPFSNIGDKTGMASIKKLVQEEYGDKWYTFGEDEEGVDQITAAIYTRMVNLAKMNPGKSILEYYEEAKADYDASEEA